MAMCNTGDESSEEGRETFQEQGPDNGQVGQLNRSMNQNLVVQCSDDDQQPRALLPRNNSAVSLMGNSDDDQTDTEEIIADIRASNEIRGGHWRNLKQTDAVMALDVQFGDKIPQQVIKMAIVQFVIEKGNLNFKAADILNEIPEEHWID